MGFFRLQLGCLFRLFLVRLWIFTMEQEEATKVQLGHTNAYFLFKG
jgi:hypothetical protein